ncbi:MAG: metallophosphoesterase [Verrucomicrobiota bacterium]
MGQIAKPPKASNSKDFDHLKERLGEELLSQRMLKQANHYARLSHQGEGIFKFERFVKIDELAKWCLQATFLWRRAHQNIFDIETVEQTWHLHNLPKSFEGFRLLHLSDLHIDIDPGLNLKVAEAIRNCPHDAIVITGDYRNSTDENCGPSMELIKPILEASDAPKYGILGNHDFIEMVWDFESNNFPVLLNEAAPIERKGERLWIVGVDDPHFYKTHNFTKARADIPEGACCILLCHSPEAHTEAAAHKFDLMLSGHTHAGQICLPGGRHIVLPVKGLKQPFIRGRWRSGDMQGYTSRGTGSCGVAARLNCRPEVTLHVLRKA